MRDDDNFSADCKFVARVMPSPNVGPRTLPIDMIVLHYTEQTGPDALDRLRDPIYKVSSHYLVYEDGRVDQLVPEALRAQHAGVSLWEGVSDNNSRSIGIEIVNLGHSGGLPDFPDAQIEAVIALCHDILARHPIRADRVVAHSDIAPARKIDPGEKFPWARLAAAGVGLWVEPTPIKRGAALGPGAQGGTVADLQRRLARYGYGLEATGEYDDATGIVVAAFQRHFRPACVDGIADRSTVDTLHRLLTAQAALA
jgi:N-acetylmuramoyl-L-alanine amidase